MSAVGKAPGKVILVGEHAVVYGRPAIAVPVWDVQATARIEDGAPGVGCTIIASDIDTTIRYGEASDDEPLAMAVRLALEEAGQPANPDWVVHVTSQIPIASGLGSGAAVCAAIVRAVFAMAGRQIEADQVSRIVYASEELHHGTPSGIDNTVVSYGQPVWFRRGEAPAVFDVGKPFLLAIADSGVSSPTRHTVASVGERWQSDPARYEAIFDAIGDVVAEAYKAILEGKPSTLGPLFVRNQALLSSLGVSTQQLDVLVNAAMIAGAAGAKLSGGGGGGNIIALVDQDTATIVREALLNAGAKNVLITKVG